MIVLLHSPLVGPATWAPVARWLNRAGRAARVADPRSPIAERGALLVAHSNAGLYAPALADLTGAAATIYVDAALPGDSGSAALAPDDLRAHLDTLVEPDGLLPPWHQWWAEEAVADLFPDAVTQDEVERETPRLPLSYVDGQVPVPAGWATRPSAYLAFGETYAEEAARARRLGWPVRLVDGGHLHQLHDSAGVGDAVLALAAELVR